jgi:hypothetical protein
MARGGGLIWRRFNRVIKLLKHLVRVERIDASCMEATLNILYRENTLTSCRIGL